jgi:hypothetical protein
MTRIMLRGLRVDPLDELKTRLEQYFEEISQTPVIFYGNTACKRSQWHN